jgi:AcrR family transcriptional regulator
MSRRRDEGFEKRRQQIIDGALRVFSTKGFVQATNKDIAVAAGIGSAGLIYHYFHDKADLLRAVVEEHAPPVQIIASAEQIMELSPRDALMQLGMTWISIARNPDTSLFIRLVLSESLRNPEFGRMFGEVGPLRVWEVLARYLGRQMEAGHLRRMDPDAAARCFVGPLAMHIVASAVLQSDAGKVSAEALVMANVDLFLQGLSPEQS